MANNGKLQKMAKSMSKLGGGFHPKGKFPIPISVKEQVGGFQPKGKFPIPISVKEQVGKKRKAPKVN